MVYVGEHGQNLWWATAKPNGQWSNVQLPFSGAQDVQPALGVHSDGKLYLAWHEFIAAKPATYVNGRLTSPAQPEQNNIRYSSWTGANRLRWTAGPNRNWPEAVRYCLHCVRTGACCIWLPRRTAAAEERADPDVDVATRRMVAVRTPGDRGPRAAFGRGGAMTVLG